MTRCEIGGCFRTPVEKAHIKSKGAGGTAKPDNIIRLCVGHHRLDTDSFHNAGVWTFAKLHNLTERFERAFEIERGRLRERLTKRMTKRRTRERLICPTCRRRWSGRQAIRRGTDGKG